MVISVVHCVGPLLEYEPPENIPTDIPVPMMNRTWVSIIVPLEHKKHQS